MSDTYNPFPGPDEGGMLRPGDFAREFGEIRAMSTMKDDRVATALTRREYIRFDWPSKRYVRERR